jgi:hypothetical protein
MSGHSLDRTDRETAAGKDVSLAARASAVQEFRAGSEHQRLAWQASVFANPDGGHSALLTYAGAL